ncbi:hypothetical protein DFP72DRAFT_873313 [Ephemerocybe angulata]|uniref:F-box domain-containing protein n=1 Tax=Ephemerocybe angulata TaxID=980116 RepID=A0A8H6IH64_9AGAR|nr:hypothetical protein DFP72DRAFT_873313 [Tulosesus angulatus]
MDAQSLWDFTRNNLALDASGQSLVQERMDGHLKELQSWRRKVKAAKILLDSLEGKAKVAARRMTMWSTILAPIRRVPLEVLTEIFTLACLGDVFHLFPDVDAKAPIATSHSLIHVCKYWRDTAIRTPQMWNHFVVVHPAFLNKPQFRWEHLLTVYGKNLTRVDLHLLKDGFPETAIDLSESIFKYQHQYTSLRLEAPISAYEWSPDTFHTPLLKDLVFICRPYTDELAPYTEWSLQFEAPMLKKLSIYYDFPLKGSNLKFPWTQLTHLFLAPAHPDAQDVDVYNDFFNFLGSLVNVTYLGLGGVTLGNSWAHPPSKNLKVIIPNLRHLEIQDPSFFLLAYSRRYSNGVDVLAHISAPVLTTFDLTFNHTEGSIEYLGNVQEHINTFLERTPLLSKVRVLLSLASWPRGLPPGRRLDKFPILVLSGDSQRFEEFANINDTSFSRHGEIWPKPFARWPPEVMFTTDHFIDRFLERDDPLFQRTDGVIGGYGEEEDDHYSDGDLHTGGSRRSPIEELAQENSKWDGGGGGDSDSEADPKAEHRYGKIYTKDALEIVRAVFRLLARKHGVVDGERIFYITH